VWIQGVGSPYTAGMIENTLPDGTTKGAIDEAAKMFNQAHEKCPDVPIVSGDTGKISRLWSPTPILRRQTDTSQPRHRRHRRRDPQAR
jgi:hypothetical protein